MAMVETETVETAQQILAVAVAVREAITLL
jgi:hypothetical protein